MPDRFTSDAARRAIQPSKPFASSPAIVKPGLNTKIGVQPINRPTHMPPKTAAPPVYRPPVLQPKMAAPPAYRSTAVQPKTAAPAAYRSPVVQPKMAGPAYWPSAVQPKLAAPQVYRPQVPVQPKLTAAPAYHRFSGVASPLRIDPNKKWHENNRSGRAAGSTVQRMVVTRGLSSIIQMKKLTLSNGTPLEITKKATSTAHSSQGQGQGQGYYIVTQINNKTVFPMAWDDNDIQDAIVQAYEAIENSNGWHANQTGSQDGIADATTKGVTLELNVRRVTNQHTVISAWPTATNIDRFIWDSDTYKSHPRGYHMDQNLGMLFDNAAKYFNIETGNWHALNLDANSGMYHDATWEAYFNPRDQHWYWFNTETQSWNVLNWAQDKWYDPALNSYYDPATQGWVKNTQ